MKKRAVIVSGGTVEIQVFKEQIRKDDFIIGVDRGLDFLDSNQIVPDYIVGDFDSISEEVIQKYKVQTEIPIREFNPVKDASDTEIAVRLAMELGHEEILILGGTGTRIDHMWANVQVLSIPFQMGIKAEIMDMVNKISLIDRYVKKSREELYGPYFSLFALDGEVEGLTIRGAKYPLNDHKLLPYDSLSVSNQIAGEWLEISYKSGILICMECKEG